MTWKHLFYKEHSFNYFKTFKLIKHMLIIEEQKIQYIIYIIYINLFIFWLKKCQCDTTVLIS